MAGATAALLLWACAGGGESEGSGGGGDTDASDASTGGTAGTGASGGSSGSAGSSGAAGSGAAGAGGNAGSAGADASTDASIDVDDAGPDGDAATEPIPCSEIPEDCNGLDDNCNGVVDEGNPGGGGACTDPQQKGVCVDGTLECENAVLVCVPNLQPSSELCNGLDDNCNGVVDEDNPEGNAECNTGNQGICAFGTTNCNNGSVECVPNAQPQTEICNGLDDDCDGTPDEGFAGSGQPCTVPGVTPNTPCAQGLTNCLGGQTGCTQTVFPDAETCDGKDNDCNGTIDDPAALDGAQCSTGLQGVCAAGLTKCTAGALNCQPNVSPGTQPETCNALDDNCDGNVDNVANINLECSQKLPQASKVASWLCTVGFCSIQTCSSNWGDCNGTPGDGCEVDFLNDPVNCGSCGKVCNASNGSPYCELGTCKIACDPGFGNCDGNAENGCETPLTSVNNCGGCGVGCTNANGSTICSQMSCVPTCSSGFGNCDANANNGCETNLGTTTAHCGACGLSCVNPNGTTSCAGGTCAPVCSPGWSSCDGNPTNGCETNLNTNVNDCGACGNQCTNANGTTSCVNGTCSPSCSSGSANCDGNVNNGCETNVNTSSSHCGACGNQCTNAHGTTSCVGGTCTPICSTGFASCDGTPGNGCETNLQTDANHCGSCGSQCVNPNGTTSCAGGSCAPVCSSGFGNCDGDAKNGCETATSNNVNHCGACGTVCSNSHGTTSCTNGSCTPSCSAGWTDCDGNPNNGCETNTGADVDNCGTCGNECVNPNGSVSCSGGQCQLGCSPGFANCDGNVGNGCETNITTNVNNCGGCGQQCVNPNGMTGCVGGSCAPICLSGWGSCDGDPANGCETNLNNSTNHCGTCGKSCTNAHGTTSCSAGTCAPVCSAGWADCDGDPTNGCETNTNTSTGNCGACGVQCVNPNGLTSCIGGACVPQCSAGAGNCDGNAVNGCETNTSNDTNHCGVCNNKCTNPNGSVACSGGVCAPGCNPGFASCDGNPGNGCETNTTNNASHCGGCGNSCTSPMPPNTTGAACSSSSCAITSCAPNFFNMDGTHSNGCECQGDSFGSSCGTATNLGSVPLDGTGSTNGNLVPAGNSDWFQLTFQPAASCNFNPKVSVTAAGPVAIQVYTACSSGSPSGGQTCVEGGTSASTANLKTWEITYPSGCGNNLPADPSPANGPFITAPTTVWVRVFATGSSSTCLPYTLSWSN